VVADVRRVGDGITTAGGGGWRVGEPRGRRGAAVRATVLREHGEIYREVSWTIPFRTGSSNNVEHGFEGRFVNQKDVDTALWEIRLEFHKGGERVGNPLTCYLTDSNEAVRFLNLAPAGGRYPAILAH
jgi:hypothetical protein